MSRPPVALIVHGAVWPDPARPATLRDRVRQLTGAAVDVVVARDEPARPRGAAACLNEAMSRVEADTVLMVDAVAPCTDADLDRVLAAIDGRADAVASLAWLDTPENIASRADADVSAPSGDGFFQTLIQAAGMHGAPGRDDPAVWAVRRSAWLAADGLDPDLWSVGAVEDLATRLTVAGHLCTPIASDAAQTVTASYPLADDVHTWLAWRNPLRTAARSLPDDAMAATLGRLLVRLLASSWRATGIDARSVQFGGAWGRDSLGARALTSLGVRVSGDPLPADESGTVLPLLALLACARELPALVEARRRQPPSAQGDAVPRAAAALESPDEPPREVQLPSADFAVPPKVSAVVVTWNGRQHLHECFASLLASDYPADRLEVVCVDNGSSDDTVSWVAAHFPQVRLVPLAENRGFTGGNAAGVAAATGDVLLFLNNDMRVEPTLVRHLVDALRTDTACVAARVMSWDGAHIDFVRGTASFEARGYQEHYQQPYTPGMRLADSFFPNGGAFAVTRTAYEEAGGFDARLFAYYDDVDLGWRLRALGHGIRTVPDAVAYHRHGATVRTQPRAHKRWLMDRNALWIALRNYDDVSLPRMVPALLLLAGLRVAQDLHLARSTTRRRLRPWITESAGAAMPPDVYATSTPGERAAPQRLLVSWPLPQMAAIGDVLTHLSEVHEARQAFQTRRRVDDVTLLPHLGRPFETLDGRTSYRRAQRALVDLLHLRAVVGDRPHVVIVTHEALRRLMSGPAVRVLEMGRALSRSVRVSIASPGPIEIDDPRVATIAYDPASPTALRTLAESADVLIVQGFALHSYPFLTRLVAPIVVDLYCPFTLEHLEQTRRPGEPDAAVIDDARSILNVQNAQFAFGDLFLCASERQRDFWIGALHTAGRVNPRTLADDPALTDLVRVVPFGLPDEPFDAAAAHVSDRRRAAGRPARVLKGVHPAIPEHARVLLWGGSLLDWQDPETLIDAVARLTAHRDDVRLFFMGVRHPNPQVSPMAVVDRARARALSLGVLDTHVIFNDWVPYDERAAYLAEADIGVSTHRLHLETRYSFRTRMLDYLWAGLPIVCTEGDYFGDLVRAEGLGRAVPPGDASALADAIATLLDDPRAADDARAALTRVATGMTWSAAVEPLRQFCVGPRFAPDRAGEVARFHDAMARSFAGTHAARRALLSVGLSEGTLETVKRWPAVRRAMTLRNRLAVWRARRRAALS